jgi:hypothetical protein
MNERIQNLCLEFGNCTGNSVLKNASLFEEFAQLIAREVLADMAQQMFYFGDEQSNNPVWYKAEAQVKKNFGVKQ